MRYLFHTVGFLKKIPPVRLDALRSIQPDSHIRKTRAYALLRLLRIRVLLIWEWVANPTLRLHCHKWHADRALDCNRTGGKNYASAVILYMSCAISCGVS